MSTEERPEGMIDIGEGFGYSFFGWSPDRELNPQYEGIPSVTKAGIMLWHDGDGFVGSCTFDNEETRDHPVRQGRPVWQLHSLSPLHIEPSIQTYRFERDPATGKSKHVPQYHGWIRGDRWVWA